MESKFISCFFYFCKRLLDEAGKVAEGDEFRDGRSEVCFFFGMIWEVTPLRTYLSALEEL
jgi:hypothetical protein